MSDQLTFLYMGFEVQSDAREYKFSVRDALKKQGTDYILSICNEAFTSHRVRYQDAAEICSIRLRRELESNREQPATRFSITDADLALYRDLHIPVAKTRFQRTGKE